MVRENLLSAPKPLTREDIMKKYLITWLCCVALASSACGNDDPSSGEDGALDSSTQSEADANTTATTDINADTTAADTNTSDDTMASADTNTPDVTSNDQTLSERHPGDAGLTEDPSVLFHDDFEAGWGRWNSPDADTAYLTMQSDAATAHAGSGYLQSRVTRQDLEETMYISSASKISFERQEEIYWRFYARMPEVAPNPHHWVRVAAGNEAWNSSGLANTVPAGDEGFWFDLDINNRDVFNFYTYWHQMRSGRCDDGSATPGCEGDQGSTYYYGNTFRPPTQTAYPRDEWFCIELRAKANSVSQSDGELSFWINDELIGDYRPGNPNGTWLRDSFHTDGCEFSACTAPEPFEGFDFRTSAEVGFKSVILDAYYERGSSQNKRAALEALGLTVSDNQIIFYDDVVVATERIGCRVP